MKFLKSCFLLLLITQITVPIFAQKFIIKDNNNQAAVGALLYLLPKGNKKKIFRADKNGTINTPEKFAKNGTKYRVHYFGYKDVSGIISSRKDIVIKLIPKPKSLNRAVVTGQIGKRKAENSLHKIRVIDKARIENQAAMNLKDLLNNELNIRLSQDQILGSGASIQGVTGQNLKIMIDGVPVIGRLNGNVDLSQINLSNTARVEIVEGPLSVSYGSNALAGTINLISKKHISKQTTTNINAYYETVGQYNVDVQFGRKFKNQNVRLSGGRYFFDGWSPRDGNLEFPNKKLADTNRNQLWNPKEQYFAKLQHQFIKNNLTLNSNLNYYNETILNRGTPRSPYYESAFDDFYKTNRIDGGLDLRYIIDTNKILKITSAVNNYKRTKNTWRKDLTTLNSILSQSPGDQDTSEFRTYMSRGVVNSKQKNNVSYQVGYDVNHNIGIGRRLQNRRATQSNLAAFGMLEWSPTNRLSIAPGLRLIHNSRYKAPLIPSLNTRYKIGNFTFRASYARGFRAPSLKELYFEFVDINHNILGSENLKAETSNNYQFNIDYRFDKKSILQKIAWSNFYNNIANLISLGQLPNNSEYTYINIGTHKTLGTQINFTLATKNIDAEVGGAYTGRYNQLSNSTTPKYLFTPEFRTSINYKILALQNLFVSVYYKYTGGLSQYSLDANENIQQYQVQDYHMMDLNLRKVFAQGKYQVQVGCKNLFDIQNINTIGIGQNNAHSTAVGSVPVSWGRTFFTNIKLSF